MIGWALRAEQSSGERAAADGHRDVIFLRPWAPGRAGHGHPRPGHGRRRRGCACTRQSRAAASVPDPGPGATRRRSRRSSPRLGVRPTTSGGARRRRHMNRSGWAPTAARSAPVSGDCHGAGRPGCATEAKIIASGMLEVSIRHSGRKGDSTRQRARRRGDHRRHRDARTAHTAICPGHRGQAGCRSAPVSQISPVRRLLLCGRSAGHRSGEEGAALLYVVQVNPMIVEGGYTGVDGASAWRWR